MNNQLSHHKLPSLWFYLRKIQEGFYAYFILQKEFWVKNFLRTCTVKIYRDQSFIQLVSAHALFATDMAAGPRDHRQTEPIMLL